MTLGDLGGPGACAPPAAVRSGRARAPPAGRKTETELWVALSTRLQENYARMRQNGVTIESTPSPAIIEPLQSAAVTAQRAWCGKAGSVCTQILDAYKAGKP